ncbi:MAG: phosphatase [Actinomycetes bacterium]
MTRAPGAPARDELRAHLVASGIAGAVATPRENNLNNYLDLSRGAVQHLFGIRPRGAWPMPDVLALMAKRCGVSPDPSHTEGQDTIDPDLTINGLDAMADRLRQAARRRERVVVATGHPVGLRPTHTAVARGLRMAGCTLLRPAAGWLHPYDGAFRKQHGNRVRYVDDVGVAAAPDGELRHTHSPMYMQAALAALGSAGEPPPDLVVADHGWAGAAGQAGIDAVGFADCNDPALFVGEAEGLVLVCVPLDDNLAPQLYEPLTRYLLERAAINDK